MNSKVRVLVLLFSTILFNSCTQSSKQLFNQEVDVNIQLDSSVLSVSVIADSLDVPWEIAWGPDNWIWITEQKGIVSRINPTTGDKVDLLILENVWMKRTSGLLGMIVHPDQKEYPYVFVNYTFERDSQYFSRLERYTYKGDTLIEPKIIMEIPAGTGHNGSRLAFSGKDKLFWATGDIAKTGNAQDINNLNGKILRMDFEGNIPADNPIKDSYVWALGLRNVQGLVSASNGRLYASEHGDAIEDEINLIAPTSNYGWHNIEGMHDQDFEKEFAELHNAVEPIKSWTPTIAPAGLDYYSSDGIPEWKNALLLTTLKGKSLRVLKLSNDGSKVVGEDIFLEGIYGRIRDLCISPEGDVYISTSNHDWNPMSKPHADDDRILRIARVEKAVKSTLTAKDTALELESHNTGEVLYQKYCLACHKNNGKGLPGTFPSLANSPFVADEKSLIPKVLYGFEGEISMPGFNFLSNDELSKLLNYVRRSFGNKSDSLSSDEIQKYRKIN